MSMATRTDTNSRCPRRSSQIAASISGEVWWGQEAGRWGAVGERGQAASLVAGAVNGLARDAEALGDVDDLPAVLDHREHRLICPRLAGQMG
jgi:hypothetical protein